jgi:hypothetical protein
MIKVCKFAPPKLEFLLAIDDYRKNYSGGSTYIPIALGNSFGIIRQRACSFKFETLRLFSAVAQVSR